MSSDAPLWQPVDGRGWMHQATYRYGSAGVANATAVRIGEGRLALLSPPGGAAGPELLDQLGNLGEVTAIIAPNAFHRSGLPGAAARFPDAILYAPETALARVAAVLPRAPVALQSIRGLPPEVEIFAPPHMARQDTALALHTPEGTIWTLHDVVLNMTEIGSNAVDRWVLNRLGYLPGLRLNRFGLRFVLLGDRPAFSRWLAEALRRDPPAVFAPGHGAVLREPDLAQRMVALAEEIAGI